MLHITYQLEGTSGYKLALTTTWFKDGSRKLDQRAKVIQVVADAEELELIKQQFSNIPMHNGPIVIWRGKIAQFIVENIRLSG